MSERLGLRLAILARSSNGRLLRQMQALELDLRLLCLPKPPSLLWSIVFEDTRTARPSAREGTYTSMPSVPLLAGPLLAAGGAPALFLLLICVCFKEFLFCRTGII